MVVLDTIRKFVTKLKTVPKQLQALIEKGNSQRFHSTVGNIIQEVQIIIRQIWQHPYQGAIAPIVLILMLKINYILKVKELSF